MEQTRKLLASGDVTGALMIAPFGYSSSLRDGGYWFRIHKSKWHRPGIGVGPTLIDAVRAALAKSDAATSAGGPTP